MVHKFFEYVSFLNNTERSRDAKAQETPRIKIPAITENISYRAVISHKSQSSSSRYYIY